MFVYREIGSLENDLGFSLKTLYAISNNIKNHYVSVEIPKKNGELRRLSVPDEILKRVQRRISDVILSRLEISEYATAYRYGASTVKNAAAHVGKPKLLKLDILHFFDSVYYSTLRERVFTRERFSDNVSILLSMLCYFGDKLPQGAPTSPSITNVIMREFDERIGAFCREKGISYTRYCDDMTFSGDFDEREIISLVKSELLKNGFVLNNKKTRLISACQRQTVTGVVVNRKPNIQAEYRRKLRQEIYYCQKCGADEHAKHIGEADADSYLRSLLGRISYALQVCPGDKKMKDAKRQIIKIIKERV